MSEHEKRYAVMHGPSGEVVEVSGVEEAIIVALKRGWGKWNSDLMVGEPYGHGVKWKPWSYESGYAFEAAVELAHRRGVRGSE